MAEATIKLQNGTTITVSGSAEEIARVAMLYGDEARSAVHPAKNKVKNTDVPAADAVDENTGFADLSRIANTINDCEEFDALEEHVLDKNDTLNKVLMCLYINDLYFESKPPLTTGEISKVLSQLGISVATSNVSLTISRKANSYVMKDNVIKKGAIIRYWINRRGKQYFEEILNGRNVAPKKAASRKIRSKKAESKDSGPSNVIATTSHKKRSVQYKPTYNASLNLHGLGVFADKFGATNNSEYVIVFIKFLTDELKLKTIAGDDIYTCFNELKSQIKLPGSFMDTLRNAQNRSHLIAYEKGFTNVTLTPKGENLFNHDLGKRVN